MLIAGRKDAGAYVIDKPRVVEGNQSNLVEEQETMESTDNDTFVELLKEIVNSEGAVSDLLHVGTSHLFSEADRITSDFIGISS